MKRLMTLTGLLSLVLTMACCSSGKQNVKSVEEASDSAVLMQTPPPNVRIYKTNGDYSMYVPVMMTADGTRLISYPAPGDVAGCEPIALEDGWLLDRRGVGYNTCFTGYTYPEYAALKKAPLPSELLKSVQKDARVTDIVEMPFSYTPGCEDRCNALIKSGLEGCTPLKR